MLKFCDILHETNQKTLESSQYELEMDDFISHNEIIETAYIFGCYDIYLRLVGRRTKGTLTGFYKAVI